MATTLRDAEVKIARREPFAGSSLSGIKGANGTGNLTGDTLSQFWQARRDGRVVYTVYSYSTPIGWVETDADTGETTAVVPDAKYSVTTSKHQGIVRRNLN